MSTGTDAPTTDVVGLLADTVERGASLLAGGNRLAGPAATQDDASELIPSDGPCVGLGLTYEDGTAVAVMLVQSLAEELCGSTAPDAVTSGLQVVSDEIGSGLSRQLIDTTVLADSNELVSFLSGRPLILGAGIFDGDDIVCTIGAATAGADWEPPSASAPAAAAAVAEPDPSPAPAPSAAPQVDLTPDPSSFEPAGPAPAPGAMPTTSSTLSGLASNVTDEVLARGLAMLADVNLDMTAELGRSHLRVSELLALQPGSVIGLEREAGSPVDLLVNGSLFARAEVIVVEDRYAVRIIELVGNGQHQ